MDKPTMSSLISGHSVGLQPSRVPPHHLARWNPELSGAPVAPAFSLVHHPFYADPGCLIYELAALSPPFNAPNERQLSVKIKAGKCRRLPSKFSDDLQRAVR